MKIIYVILLGLVVFNFMLVFTESIGVFPGEIYTGEQINSTQEGASFTDMSAQDLLVIAVGGLSLGAVAGAAIIFTMAAIAAFAFKSPAPLAIGGFASVFTGIWIQTASSLTQFSIHPILLGAGTVGIGLLFIINVISLAGGQTDG